MTAYQLEIWDTESGELITHADVDALVGEIEAVRSEDALGIIVRNETVAVGYLTVEQALHSNFELRRWAAGSGAAPISVTRIDGEGQKKANQ